MENQKLRASPKLASALAMATAMFATLPEAAQKAVKHSEAFGRSTLPAPPRQFVNLYNSPEIIEHNEKIELKRQEKLARRKLKK